ncbi:SUMF1/EgtB/PvdO family nonheme iron enzyme [Anatilimnocola sp. NA78]|uniref:SUMF1/EgtB/PvdO family nonheme iron enzyme n=1 Tax=Anatilimnocola sp. NA78 TaxID=3415683 RepID=UPI003CE5755B
MRSVLYRLVATALLVACAWVMLHADDPPALPRDKEIEALIQQLGSDEFAAREAAVKALDRLGERPLPYLRHAASKNSDPEIRWRAEHLLSRPDRESETTGLKLVFIQRGEAWLGSPNAEAGRRDDELTHLARLTQAFYLGKYEVTQSEYRRVMKQEPSWFSRTGGGREKVFIVGTDLYPVERVTWFDAIAFCNELSKLDHFQPYYELTEIKRENDSIVAARVKIVGGHGYRLPTEAEWEHACRAGTTTPYHYGAERNGHASNVAGATFSGGYGGEVRGPNLKCTCSRGGYEANAWGLHDMHGNVGEWCWDVSDRNYYRTSPRNDPSGPDDGPHRTWRGGNWLLNEAGSRSAARNFAAPSERKEYLGFRVARNP